MSTVDCVTITEFLEARIAEDEQAARNASPGPWSYSSIDSIGGGTIYDATVAIAGVQWDNEPVDSRIRRARPDWQADATGSHIARHDPARALAECAAKRAIIKEWEDPSGPGVWEGHDAGSINHGTATASCLAGWRNVLGSYRFRRWATALCMAG